MKLLVNIVSSLGRTESIVLGKFEREKCPFPKSLDDYFLGLVRGHKQKWLMTAGSSRNNLNSKASETISLSEPF